MYGDHLRNFTFSQKFCIRLQKHWNIAFPPTSYYINKKGFVWEQRILGDAKVLQANANVLWETLKH